MRIFNRYYSAYHLLLPLVDLGVALAIAGVGRLVIDSPRFYDDSQWFRYLIQGGAVGVIVVIVFYYTDLYSIDSTFPGRDWVLRLITGLGITCLLLGGLSQVMPRPAWREISLTSMLLIGVGLFVWRIQFTNILKRRTICGKILIVGTQSIGQIIAEELHRCRHLAMDVVGFVGFQAGQMQLSYGNPTKVTLPVFARHSTIEVVESKGVDRILVDGPESCENFPAQDLVMLRLRGVPVEDCHHFYERIMGKIPTTDLHPSWIILSEGFRRNRWISFTKRAVDVVVSTVGLILAVPVAILAAIAIKLDSHGPVIYSQERVGEHERRFNLYKFRSMQHQAEAASGPVWAAQNDPRVTRVGKILRKLRIDEIPQMVNVLKGEMSFVGPRPERAFFVAKLKEKIPYYHLRFSVKPGITGWAQISYPYGDSEEDAIEKLHYDLYYVKNISAMFDLQIIFETLKIVLLRRGAQ